MIKYNFKTEAAPKAVESLTPEAFIKKYFESTESFKNMIVDTQEFVPNYRADLEAALNYIAQGCKIDSPIRWRKNKATGMPYMRFDFGLFNGLVPLMIVDHDNLKMFFDDYQRGKVKTTFSYSELINFINS